MAQPLKPTVSWEVSGSTTVDLRPSSQIVVSTTRDVIGDYEADRLYRALLAARRARRAGVVAL